MKITFCCANTSAEPWLQGLCLALPQAEVNLWHSGAAQADYAVVWGAPQTFFDEQTQLKGIFNTGAGVDALLRLRLPEGVPLVRLEDVGMAAQMAEYVCHAVFRYYREWDAVERDMRQGIWQQRRVQPRSDFAVGVLGLGVLGQRVATALQHFDFPVRGWSRSLKTLPGVDTFSGASGLPDFLRGTRVLVCLLPLTPETQDILSRQTLSQLQPNGFVINVARGAHLVDDDLLALLDEGHLAGATLDVFRTEPLPAEHPFWKHPKITLTPHTSARTLRQESIAQIAQGILAMERGELPGGVVNRNLGY